MKTYRLIAVVLCGGLMGACGALDSGDGSGGESGASGLGADGAGGSGGGSSGGDSADAPRGGGNASSPERPDDGSGGGTSGSPGSGSGGGGGGDATPVSPADPAEPMRFCGGLVGVACGEGEYCEYGPSCGFADQGGVCARRPEVCTEEYAPVCGCDGNTYGNVCSARGAGVSVVRRGECPDDTVPTPDEPPPVDHGFCGGIAGFGCAAGEFCDYALDALCGAADQGGTCRAVPEACTLEYAPVCGCDGHTYGNACGAHSAGVSVAARGECAGTSEPDPGTGETSCGGWSQHRCSDREFCDFSGDWCDWADASGVCRPRPQACDAVYAPVCGCDGQTYSNECVAHAAGVDAALSGACQ